MNINATLLIQAINFVIVYWMLKIFLFKPVISLIEHEDGKKKALLDIINQQQTSLAIQEKERQRHWYLCQEYFTHNRPRQLSSKFLRTITSTTSHITSTLTPEDVATISTEIRTRLEEKIKHVH